MNSHGSVTITGPPRTEFFSRLMHGLLQHPKTFNSGGRRSAYCLLYAYFRGRGDLKITIAPELGDSAVMLWSHAIRRPYIRYPGDPE